MRFAKFTKIDEKGAVRVLTDTCESSKNLTGDLDSAGTLSTPSNNWYLAIIETKICYSWGIVHTTQEKVEDAALFLFIIIIIANIHNYLQCT